MEKAPSGVGERFVLLVRHGQCQDNLAGVIPGQRGSALTVLGREQALQAANRVRDHEIVAVHASDIQQAAASGELIAKVLGLPLVVDPDLREQSYGSLEGRRLSDSYVQRATAGVHAHDVRAGGGESIADVYERAARYFARLADEPPGDVVVVSHSTWIQVAVACLNGRGPYEVEWGDLPNGAVVVHRLTS